MAWRRLSPLVANDKELAIEVARVEALFNSIGEAVIATDEQGKIMRVNGATLELFECKESDLLDKKYMSTVPAYDLKGSLMEPFSRPIVRSLMEGKSVSDTLLYTKKRSGKRFPAHVTVSPIMLNGKPTGAIQVMRDVTREQQIDKAKTEFVSLASHQLRTPLTAMRWYIELLLKDKMGELSDHQRMALQEVYEVNLRLIELVASLLSVARIEIGTLSVTPEPSDIVQLARDVVFELKPMLVEKRLRFKEHYDTIPSMQLDPDLTRIIFQNILTNAVKYTPPDGKVTLSVKREKHSVLIEISDTGYGIPKHQQRHMFTKLFRADNARQNDTDGTGLGLYIVKSIVKNAKGKVWFVSEENVGTTFYIRLPLKGMPPVEPKK